MVHACGFDARVQVQHARFGCMASGDLHIHISLLTHDDTSLSCDLYLKRTSFGTQRRISLVIIFFFFFLFHLSVSTGSFMNRINYLRLFIRFITHIVYIYNVCKNIFFFLTHLFSKYFFFSVTQYL